MPLLFGPKNSRYAYTGSPCPHNDLALESAARTLGEALREYEQHFKVAVDPCTEPVPGETEVKYFLISEPDGKWRKIVDIHVIRGSEEICPKHDLSFVLEALDIVEMGELIC